MSKSLADLRAEHAARESKPVRAERVYTAVVGDGQKLVAQIQRLTEEHDELLIQPPQETEGPRKMGAKPETPARVAEILEELADLGDKMGEYEGELTIAATKTEGEWEQWRIQHPARGEDEPGRRDDMTLAGGACNVDELIADLATYVVAWRGEPLLPGDFDALSILRPDKKEIAALVVGMYETGDDLPKLRSGLSALRNKSGTSSNSPTS